MTFNDPKFEDRTPDGSMYYDGDWFAPSGTEIKKGTIVTADPNSDKTIKVVDDSATSLTYLTYYPMILVNDVRDLSGGVYNYRSRVDVEVRGFSENVNVICRPGHIIRIQDQVTADGQAGWVISSSIKPGTLLFTALDSTTGAPNGGITDASSVDIDTTTYYGQLVGVAKNSVSSAGDYLEFVYTPGIIGAYSVP